MDAMRLDAAGAVFRTQPKTRTISGLLVEWNTIAPSGGKRWKFAPDSLYWSAVSRVKMNTHHDRTELVGAATSLYSSSRGLVGEFKIARTPEGDTALQMAADGILDGLSVEVDFEPGDEHGPDPADRSVTLVRRGRLRAVALTGAPAYDNARVESVLASRDQRLELRLQPAELADLRAAADASDASMSSVARDALRAYTRQRPVYAFDGSGHSFVRDSWISNHPSDGDAHEAHMRLQAFRGWQREAAAATFATVTTTSGAAVVEPAFAPTLSSFVQDRPLFAAATRGRSPMRRPSSCRGRSPMRTWTPRWVRTPRAPARPMER